MPSTVRPFGVAAEKKRGRRFFLCHAAHEHDRVYMENMGEFLGRLGVPYEIVEFEAPGQRPELRQLLDDAIGVLGLNSQLDHCWLGDENFIDAAARQNVPVVHWIVDHPSARWREFIRATEVNSRFLFVSASCESYFRRHVLAKARTAWTAGVGPNWRSRLDQSSWWTFRKRDIDCLVALNLKRLGRTMTDVEVEHNVLELPVRDAVAEAVEHAWHDLDNPLEMHLERALARRLLELSNAEFHHCFGIVDDTAQIRRRLKIFEVASRFPVLVQTDTPPQSLLSADLPTDAEATSMPATIERMKSCRSVLSASFTNDMLHDRTQNALNAGCVAIVEDTPIHRRLFRHGKNALLFRYDDDSLADCLDLVCHRRFRAYRIARAGFALRDHPGIRFGGFDNAVYLMRE